MRLAATGLWSDRVQIKALTPMHDEALAPERDITFLGAAYMPCLGEGGWWRGKWVGEEEEVRGVFIEQSWREAKIKEDVDMWQDPGSACLDLMEILYAEQVARAYTCMHVTKYILLYREP